MDAIMSWNRQVEGRAQKNATAVEGVKDSPAKRWALQAKQSNSCGSLLKVDFA